MKKEEAGETPFNHIMSVDTTVCPLEGTLQLIPLGHTHLEQPADPRTVGQSVNKSINT